MTKRIWENHGYTEHAKKQKEENKAQFYYICFIFQENKKI